jgi:hypothetical protein
MATAMIAPAQYENPIHDHQHFELWQIDYGHQAGVHDGVVHSWNKSAINTLEPAPL